MFAAESSYILSRTLYNSYGQEINFGELLSDVVEVLPLFGSLRRGPRKRLESRADSHLQRLRLIVHGAVRLALQLLRAG